MTNGVRALVAALLDGFPSESTKRAYSGLVGLLWFLFPFSLVFIVGGVLPEQFAWTASIIIALQALAVLVSESRAQPWRSAVLRFLLLSGLLFGVENLGVRIGFPFGSYSYTDALGFMVAGVPLAISFAWYGTVINTWRMAQWILGGRGAISVLPVAAVAGVLTLALDLVLEPMASSAKQYWLWDGGTVPLQNYLSWFVFAVAAVLVLTATDRSRSPLPRGTSLNAAMLFGMQWVLFALTDVVHGEVSPVALSALALAVIAFFFVPRAGVSSRPEVVRK